jgi:hypothetical protein
MPSLGFSGGAQTEKQKKLPSAQQPKTIEPPKPRLAPRTTSDMDDDIPFSFLGLSAPGQMLKTPPLGVVGAFLLS